MRVADLEERGRANRLAIAITILVVIGLLPARTALAARTHPHHRKIHKKVPRIVAPLYHAELLEDADSGKILYQLNPELPWPPASMAKMMLLLVTEDQIKAGRLKLSDPVIISARSAHTGGSRLGLREGQVYPLGELMKAALIRSANDAAVAIGQKVGGGSLAATVEMMNAKAKNLGMSGTHYNTVDGLPPTPGHDVDVTDARDLATLARALIGHTDLLKWSGMETAVFDGGVAILHNTNHLIGHFPGCDGLKTGFTFQSGFNLTATAKRGNMRVIAVVLGAPTNAERFIQAAALMEKGFKNFTSVPVLLDGQHLPVQVRTAAGVVIDPVAAHAVNVVVPKADVNNIHFEYKIPATVVGPVAAGEALGQVTVIDGASVLAEVNAICPLSTISKRPAAGKASARLSMDDLGAGSRPDANQENR